MAFSLVQHNHSETGVFSNATSGTSTFTNNTKNNLLVVTVNAGIATGVSANQTDPTVTDTSGNTYTLIKTDHGENATSDQAAGWIFACLNAKAFTGTNTVTVNFSGSAQNFISIFLAEFSWSGGSTLGWTADQSSSTSKGDSLGNNPNTGMTSTVTTGAAANEIAVATNSNWNADPTHGSGWTALGGESIFVSTEYQFLSATGAVTATWSTTTTVNYATVLATFYVTLPSIPSNVNAYAVLMRQANTTTWNPSNLSNGTLTTGNLTFTETGSTDGGTCGLTPLSTGKYYFEATSNNPSGGDTGVGISNSAPSFTGIGATSANAIVTFTGAGTLWIAGHAQGINLGAIVDGSIVGVATDIANQLVWIRLNGGPWNANNAADPAKGLGGLSGSTISLPWVPVCTGSASTSSGWTANFGGSGFSQIVPNGFSSWGLNTTPTTINLNQPLFVYTFTMPENQVMPAPHFNYGKGPLMTIGEIFTAIVNANIAGGGSITNNVSVFFKQSEVFSDIKEINMARLMLDTESLNLVKEIIKTPVIETIGGLFSNRSGINKSTSFFNSEVMTVARNMSKATILFSKEVLTATPRNINKFINYASTEVFSSLKNMTKSVFFSQNEVFSQTNVKAKNLFVNFFDTEVFSTVKQMTKTYTFTSSEMFLNLKNMTKSVLFSANEVFSQAQIKAKNLFVNFFNTEVFSIATLKAKNAFVNFVNPETFSQVRQTSKSFVLKSSEILTGLTRNLTKFVNFFNTEVLTIAKPKFLTITFSDAQVLTAGKAISKALTFNSTELLSLTRNMTKALTFVTFELLTVGRFMNKNLFFSSLETFSVTTLKAKNNFVNFTTGSKLTSQRSISKVATFVSTELLSITRNLTKAFLFVSSQVFSIGKFISKIPITFLNPEVLAVTKLKARLQTVNFVNSEVLLLPNRAITKFLTFINTQVFSNQSMMSRLFTFKNPEVLTAIRSRLKTFTFVNPEVMSRFKSILIVRVLTVGYQMSLGGLRKGLFVSLQNTMNFVNNNTTSKHFLIGASNFFSAVLGKGVDVTMPVGQLFTALYQTIILRPIRARQLANTNLSNRIKTTTIAQNPIHAHQMANTNLSNQIRFGGVRLIKP